MKIRNGFVSNSSSSSFVVPFNRIPHSVDEIKAELFPDNDWNDFIIEEDWSSVDIDENGNETPTIEEGDQVSTFTVRQFLEHMFEDMRKNRPLFAGEIRYQMHGLGWEKAADKLREAAGKDEYGNLNWNSDVPDEMIDEETKLMVDPFIQENRGRYFYFFEYANDGNSPIEREMKDFNIFRNKKHLVVHNG